MENTILDSKGNPCNFSYDAIKSKGRRKAPTAKIISEDLELSKKKKTKLISSAIEQNRNIALLQWMVQTHLSYVSQFNLFVDETIPVEVQKETENLFRWHGRKKIFDVAERHSRNEMLRLFEYGKVTQGDALLLKTKIGSLQLIEGHLINKPNDLPKDLIEQVQDTGLVIDEFGKTIAYCLCKQVGKSYYFDKMLDAQDVLYDGYFSRGQQTRGVSPLSTAINTLADIYENFDMLNLKQKLHNVMGLAIMRGEIDDNGFTTLGRTGTQTDIDGEETTRSEYDVSFNNGPLFLDLDPNDKVELFESNTPSQNVIEYSKLLIRIALLSLDIPYSMFDSKGSSWNARVADINDYEFKCAWKRQKNIDLLLEYSDWKIRTWYNTIPSYKAILDKNNVSYLDLQKKIEFIPVAKPWVNKLQQVNAEMLAIAGGLESQDRVIKRNFNGDRDKILDEIAGFQKSARDKGAQIIIGQSGQQTVEEKEKAVDDTEDN